MQRCDDYEPLIERMLADEIDDTERDRLLRHAESCGDCRQFVELHHRLLGPALAVDLPTDEEFAAVRHAVLTRIRVDAPERQSWFDAFRQIWMRPAFGAGLAALLVVALGSGIIVGRQWPGTELRAAGTIVPPDSPVLYSNVSLRDQGDDTVVIGYDETRHVQAELGAGDQAVKRILLQSMLSESTVGSRLETMSHARRFQDPEVRQAMIVTLLNDPHQPVRQRALEILAAYEVDESIQAALLAVLRDEESVNLRLMAMDLLVTSDLPEDRFRQLVDDLQEREDRALVVRAASYDPSGQN
jgi:hypothetical protein